MHLDKYECLADATYVSFTFESVGPRGSVKKVVSYMPISGFVLADGRQVINLGFGDWNEENQKIDDLTVTNNQDRDKVLSTVASTIIKFTNNHGKLPVFARGSSPVKTRLYQMGINAYITEIEELFIILGLVQGKWDKFKSGVNYDAFLVIRK